MGLCHPPCSLAHMADVDDIFEILFHFSVSFCTVASIRVRVPSVISLPRTTSFVLVDCVLSPRKSVVNSIYSLCAFALVSTDLSAVFHHESLSCGCSVHVAILLSFGPSSFVPYPAPRSSHRWFSTAQPTDIGTTTGLPGQVPTRAVSTRRCTHWRPAIRPSTPSRMTWNDAQAVFPPSSRAVFVF